MSKIQNTGGPHNGDLSAALYGGRAMHGEKPPAVTLEMKAERYYAAYECAANYLAEKTTSELKGWGDWITAELGRRAGT